MRDDDEIDNTCERLIRLAVFAMETSTTSVDRLSLRRSRQPLSVSTQIHARLSLSSSTRQGDSKESATGRGCCRWVRSDSALAERPVQIQFSPPTSLASADSPPHTPK